MNPFKKMSTEGMEQARDTVGGFAPKKTGIYLAVLKVAYAGASEGGAQNVSFIFTMPDGSEHRETIYVTNRNGEHWFHPKDKSGKVDTTKMVPLPGFTTVDHIFFMLTGNGIADQEWEEKIVKIWDKDAKAEVPKSVMVPTGALGQSVKLGIHEVIENKNEKVGNEYVPTAEERRSNAIDKVFHAELDLTVVEGLEGKSTKEEATFIHDWLAANTDPATGLTKPKDKRTFGKNGAKSGKPGSPPPVAGAPAATPGKALFGKK